MERETEIENRIGELRNDLTQVEGTPTEIYTRIVGYYRSLKNWNKGKREEYDHRVTFQPDSSGTPGAHTPALATADPGPAPAAEAFAAAAIAAAAIATPAHSASATPDSVVSSPSAISSYAYFFRETCPNCPPVRTYVENLSLNGQMVDVDTGAGMAQAVEHQILSTPTVILMDESGTPVAQAGNVAQLRSILESAG